MQSECAPFLDDPFILDMLDLALSDEDEARSRVEAEDKLGAWNGRLIMAFNVGMGRRAIAETIFSANAIMKTAKEEGLL